MKSGFESPGRWALSSLVLDGVAILVGWMGSVPLGLPLGSSSLALRPRAHGSGHRGLRDLCAAWEQDAEISGFVGLGVGLIVTGVGVFLLTWSPQQPEQTPGAVGA